MTDQKRLEADWPKTLSEKDYPKSNLGDALQTFEVIIALLRNIFSTRDIPVIFCERYPCYARLWILQIKLPYQGWGNDKPCPDCHIGCYGYQYVEDQGCPFPQRLCRLHSFFVGYYASCLYGDCSLGACQTVHQDQKREICIMSPQKNPSGFTVCHSHSHPTWYQYA